MNNILIKLPGYELTELIYNSSKTQVYRGIYQSDSTPVIVKLMASEYPSFEELVQFRNQYSITKNLNLPGIVAPLAIENYRNRFALVMPDDGCISISDYTKTHSLSLNEFFPIAIQLAEILQNLYQNRIIHKDIKPGNILIHPETKQVKLIDFSIASLLPKQTQEIINPNILEGTLAYISPEQTGRMNRAIDYRSDFYSLGVTFFELLTGELPFQSNDPMELVHCHIAKMPSGLANRELLTGNREVIPQVLSDIVLKLMAKNAEDRYQSALGLKYDLEKCWQQWEQTGNIESFKLGQRDICDRFIIPEKLYGRSGQVKILLDAFERVNQGTTEMMLVTGFSGIGKTAVVNEVHKPIVRQKGYFIKGKYDQFQRNIPFSAFVQAFRDLMGQLLTESDAQLQLWQEKILVAVGENARVIIEVIPELEKIIGSQPEVPELSGNAAQNRFNLLFQKFIQVFTTPDHPLVIFLDDLQWVDSASLKLIELLMGEADSKYLLLIGAYRDNEVNPTHPFMLTLDELKKTQTVINTIRLAPLWQYDLNQWIADTLRCSNEEALPLTQLLYQKTKGNPFFTSQFLKALSEEKLINFNYEQGYWQCNIAEVKSLALSDDVVVFVAQRLEKLHPIMQKVLQLAACIGNQFDLKTLAIVREKSELETATDLWVLLKEGLVLPRSEIYKFYTDENTKISQFINDGNVSASYKFLHDRIQQAAYSMISVSERPNVHYRIGQLLLENIPIEQRELRLFDLVNHLNLGRELVGGQSEKYELAQLNLLAGEKGKISAAYGSAFQYFLVGLELLGVASWQQYDLALRLYSAATEAAYLNGEFEQMERFAQEVLEQAQTPFDRMAIYETKVQAYSAQIHFNEALQVVVEALAELDFFLPRQPGQLEIQDLLSQTTLKLKNRQINELVNLPNMSDKRVLAIMQMLSSAIAPAYIAAPELLTLVVFNQVNLSVEYGNDVTSSFAYAMYGLILCGILGNIESGYQFGELALQLLEKFGTKQLIAKTFVVVYTNIKPWKVHLRETIKPLKEAHQAGLDYGDFEFAGYGALNGLYYAYYGGQELSEIKQLLENYIQVFTQLKQTRNLDTFKMYLQAVLNWVEGSSEPDKLSGKVYEETEQLLLLQQNNDRHALFHFYLHKLIFSYTFAELKSVFEYANLAESYLDGVVGLALIPTFYFYDSLVRLTGDTSRQTDSVDRLTANQEKLKSWANFAPMNYHHKWLLVEAERNRIFGEKIAAIEMYDFAIAEANKNGYLQEEALANEVAAKFYLEWGKEKIAQTYMVEAYYCYARWGAKAKIEDLEKHYSHLLTPIFQCESISLTPTKTLTSSGRKFTKNTNITISSSASISEVLDLATVIRASQAVSSEIQLDKLLSTLMTVVMANAGASKGVLMLLKNQALIIEAIATKETTTVLQSTLISDSAEIPLSLVNYVKHTLESIVIDDVKIETKYASDPYIIQQQPMSLLCLPLQNKGQLIGIFYLENNLSIGAFNNNRIEIIKLLISQAVISLENALLYQKVQQSEAQEKEKSQQLEKSLQELKQAQIQLVQSEKMATIGQLVAGVAHEINNPTTFISGNLTYAEEYTQNLIKLLQLYQKELPNPGAEIVAEIEAIELDYLVEDLPQILNSMKEGSQRIQEISNSMRIFSRADTLQKVPFNIHDGIDSTLLILKHRFKANPNRPEIQLFKNYGNLPQIECFPGQLNQVFMNLIANASDVLDEASRDFQQQKIAAPSPKITITTEISPEDNWVIIKIKDNGPGMSESVKKQIFDYLFTTKEVGKGTGLGLSISRQIVEEKHGGKLNCNSAPGQGAEFVISLPIH